MAHLLALLHAGRGFLREVLVAPWHTNDMAQGAALPATLRPGDVLVGARAFCAFAHVALLRPQGLQALLRVHQKHMIAFTPLRPHTTPQPQAAQQGLPQCVGA